MSDINEPWTEVGYKTIGQQMAEKDAEIERLIETAIKCQKPATDLIAKKDAEIERQGRLIEMLFESRAKAEECSDNAHKEIKRLNDLNLSLFNDLRESQFRVGDRDKEIEQLKNKVTELKDFISSKNSYHAPNLKILKLKSLITELADFLNKKPCECWPEMNAQSTLVKRAREASDAI